MNKDYASRILTLNQHLRETGDKIFNTQIDNNNHKFNLYPINPNCNIKFNGYFQSFIQYYNDFRLELMELIYSNKELINKVKDYYNKIKINLNTDDDNMVSMHIRKTDYVYSSDYNYILDLDYYNKVLEITKKKLWFFSDDIKCCKKIK